MSVYGVCVLKWNTYSQDVKHEALRNSLVSPKARITISC